MLSEIESGALLMVYLDRQCAGRREDAERNTAARRRSAVTVKRADDEADQILGLQTAANADVIVRTRRT
jgi:hypothetical protein